jgi:hypothetical protein
VFHLLGLGVSSPSSSPHVVGEPFTILKEMYQIKEKREVDFHAKNFMSNDYGTQTEIEQELEKIEESKQNMTPMKIRRKKQR